MRHAELGTAWGVCTQLLLPLLLWQQRRTGLTCHLYCVTLNPPCVIILQALKQMGHDEGDRNFGVEVPVEQQAQLWHNRCDGLQVQSGASSAS